eukprot:g37727.t1
MPGLCKKHGESLKEDQVCCLKAQVAFLQSMQNPDIAAFEERAAKADKRIAALEAAFADLERGGGGALNVQHSEKEAGDKARKGGKAKGGKPSKAPTHPFASFQLTEFPLDAKAVEHGLVVTSHEENNQYMCMFCQKKSKVFFRCNNNKCGLRVCKDCHSICSTCNSLSCRWCRSCESCHTAGPSELADYLQGLAKFCQANAKTLSTAPGWPGQVWIHKALSRLQAFQSTCQSADMGGVSAGCFLMAALMSIDWEEEAEKRAWAFLMPLVRAQLTRTGAFNLPL